MRQNNKKLSPESVALIVALRKIGYALTDLGRMFGVTHQNIRRITQHETWNCRELPETSVLTLRNQVEADAKLPAFLTIKGNLFLSCEPLWGPVDLEHVRTGPDQPMTGYPATVWHPTGNVLRKPKPPKEGERVLVGPAWRGVAGVIVGHDNRLGVPGTDTLDHVRSVVRQCQTAGVNVYVKQLWLMTCPDCGTFDRDRDANAHRPNMKCPGGCGGGLRWRLHTDPDFFPHDLRLRNLPWSMPNNGTEADSDQRT